MKTPGDVFHVRHIKVKTFDPEYSRPRQSCWKRHSPIYKQGAVWPRRLAERVKPSERERDRKKERCVYVCVGGRVGVGEVRHQLAEHSREQGAHVTLRWPPLSLKMFQLGRKRFFWVVDFFFFFFLNRWFCVSVTSCWLPAQLWSSYSREPSASMNHCSCTDAKRSQSF